jgi:hypothetical protein
MAIGPCCNEDDGECLSVSVRRLTTMLGQFMAYSTSPFTFLALSSSRSQQALVVAFGNSAVIGFAVKGFIVEHTDHAWQ